MKGSADAKRRHQEQSEIRRGVSREKEAPTELRSDLSNNRHFVVAQFDRRDSIDRRREGSDEKQLSMSRYFVICESKNDAVPHRCSFIKMRALDARNATRSLRLRENNPQAPQDSVVRRRELPSS
jgi:hypothetical protein